MIERPLRFDDLDGLAAVTRAVPMADETGSDKRPRILLPVPVELV